jgi:uncharacterized delta-60 repeat protein
MIAAGRGFFLGVLGAALIGGAVSTAAAAPGDLDLTFAGTGKTRVGFGGGEDSIKAIAVQADGKVVAVGLRQDVSHFVLTVVRYNLDGSLDTSFKGATQPYPSDSQGTAVKIQPSDQKIVVAGNAENQFMAVRLNTDGTLDTSFNGTGIVITTAGTGKSYALAVAIQSDNDITKIVLGGQEGTYTATTRPHFALVRYMPDGTLDPSFNGDGKVSTDVGVDGGTGEAVHALAISGSTIIAAGSSSTGNPGQAFAVARYLSNGSLDTTFNNGHGFVVTPVGDAGYAYANTVAIQPSTPTKAQTIVVGGFCENSGHGDDFALVRYNSDDGSRDSSFGNNGIVQTDIDSGSYEIIYSLLVQSTGNGPIPVYKIVVGGFSDINNTPTAILARYNSSGSLDSSFGPDGGIIRSVVSSGWGGVALGNGKIIAGGEARFHFQPSNFVIARYTSNGSLDPTFDGDGQRTDSFGDADVATARAVATQADGKIVVAGSLLLPPLSGSSPSPTPRYGSALMRLNADGTADTSFGQGTGRFVDNSDGLYNAVAVQSNTAIFTGGIFSGGQRVGSATRFDLSSGQIARFSFSSSSLMSEVKAIALQVDGKVVVAGYSADISNHRDFAVARLTFSKDMFGFYNAVLDSSFGNNGVTTTDLGTDDDEANAMAIQADGKIVLAGQTSDSIAAVRYDSNGAIDTSFGVNGKVTTKVGNSINHGNGLVVQSDGKIVVTGQADSNLVLLRYGSAGTPDPSFGGVGAVLVSLGANSLGGEALSLQGDDKILVTGSGNGDFVVLRFTKDGFVDGNYGGGIKVTVDVTGANDSAHAITLDSYGRAIVAGEADNLFGIARLQGDTAIPTPTPTPTATPGLVGNVSTRLPVGTGDNALIEGFIVQGPAGSTKKIIVRAIGPSLAPFGIPDAVANPTLEIHDASANNATVATNDDWKNTQVGGLITGDQSAEIASSGVPPSNDLESAIIADLAPGGYTAVVRGAGDTTGTGVVDAYDLSAASPARLANIATRGLIQPGDKLMIAGFIVQNGPVQAVVRAIGPSLGAFGIGNALPDTTLQLRDSNGAIVRENDDWQTDQKQELESTGLQPTNDLEAALVETILPGQYTAQVRGKPEQTGIGVVQIYFLQ